MSTVMGPGDLKAIFADKDAPVEFMLLDDMIPYESVIMLAYGGSGTGKTYFVATAGPRTLIINIGNGLVTIQSPEVKRKYFTTGSPIVTTIVEERDKRAQIYSTSDAFDKIMYAIDWAMDHFGDRFDTIVVDDATQLRAFAMNKGLDLNKDFNRSETLKKAEAAGGIVTAVQDYGIEMSLIDNFVATTVSFCKKEKKHFILTAQERHIFKPMKDATGKKIGEELDRIRPGFTGKTFPDDITGHFDLVWNFEVARTGKGTIYRAYTEDSRGIKAKSRYPGVFPAMVQGPDFLKIVAAIKTAWEAGRIKP